MRLGQKEVLGRTGQETECVGGWPERACCCSAAPMVKVLLPSPRGTSHVVDLYLCGHHYRRSFGTLVESGATTLTRDQATVSR
ncbi:DUF7455 domain-containing protein [Kribbella solani]|uniref:DUF7455 domain-containing protein n=1 Tax=Kribbella solani TaxID=236067 RepID=A0A841DPY3_9ACTN|nr:hypothetical protein [Kribbella solani]MBB5978447.1 hypothetical protein [Kribbella solani]